jgi:hypothetical protein
MTDQRPEAEHVTPRRDLPPHDPMGLEKNQPDPMLQMSTGRMGSGGISLLALAVVVILAFVFYGLNGRSHDNASSQQPAAMVNSGAPHG